MSKKYKPDILIEKIYKIARQSENKNYRDDCNAMILYFVRNGYLPLQMKKRAIEIAGIEMPDQPKADSRERRYLYAIQADDEVKVGYSSNPKGRLKSLQVGSTKSLKLVWQTYAGDDDAEAKKQEKKLHRMISHFRIRGEWFKAQCLIVVTRFRVKNDYTKQEKDAEVMHSELDNQFSAIIGL